jgi:two-component system invasion response regulator UvrY
MDKIRVLLADDHPLIVAGFGMALAGQHIEVVGEAFTPDEVIRSYRHLMPDVLVLDIRFGEKMSGMHVAKEVLRAFPDATIVFLSQFDQDNIIKESYRLGGRAFVTKDCTAECLASAIHTAHRGDLYFLPEVAERLARLAICGDMSPQSLLEPREIEIFTLMAQGLTNHEIAARLALSPKTISNSSQGIKEKLGIDRAADITRLAVKHGLIEP